MAIIQFIVERQLDWIKKVIISFGSVIIVMVKGGATIFSGNVREITTFALQSPNGSVRRHDADFTYS